jgi:hypothetical protein
MTCLQRFPRLGKDFRNASRYDSCGSSSGDPSFWGDLLTRCGERAPQSSTLAGSWPPLADRILDDWSATDCSGRWHEHALVCANDPTPCVAVTRSRPGAAFARSVDPTDASFSARLHDGASNHAR